MRLRRKKSRVNQNAGSLKVRRADPETPKVEVQLDVDKSKYDESNPLVLPTRSDASVPRADTDVVGKTKKKKLSKKKEKKLRKVLERKRKLQDRKSLIEELKKHQLETKVYEAMVSTSELQTKGHKRTFDPLGGIRIPEASTKKIRPFGRKKRRPVNSLASENDPNCIGFDKSDIEDSCDDQVTEEANLNIKEAEVCQEVSQEVGTVEVANSLPNRLDTQKDSYHPSSEGESNVLPVKNELPLKKDEEAQKSFTSEKKAETSNEKLFETKHVPIYRDPDSKMEKSRLKLPIIGEEQIIMETIRYNDICIICGETGSGKTTQIPQFLYEAGYATEKKIGITEPRRVAAVAMSKRVGEEMNLGPDVVSYQIRFEGNCKETTKLKFMTDGILFKEIQKDPLLSQYSVIVIDEAHERTIYSDIIIGWLSRIIRIRKNDPLKVIIMSATLRISDFCENKRLFADKPPVIKIESRQFPVAVHFSKKTSSNYIHEAYLKVCKIHQNEPPSGGILVFVTGQKEVRRLCDKLRKTFPYNSESTKLANKKFEKRSKRSRKARQTTDNSQAKTLTLDDIALEIEGDHFNIDDRDENTDEDSDTEEIGEIPELEKSLCKDPLYCLPLYSNLNDKKQQLVFQSPPPGCRMCVVSTNVAETSLTLPNIRYVVDTGKVKVKVYDQITGISAFVINWTSKASADQRAGRAGRLGPGHCYRLYSSAVFKDSFKEYADPEIVRKPVDDLVLQMKYMNIDNIINFPFPSPPSPESLIASEKRLALLGALEKLLVKPPTKRFAKASSSVLKVTKLGKVMAQFPLSPRYSKMLILAAQHGLMKYAIFMVAGLTIQELFIENHAQDSDKKLESRIILLKKRWASSGNSLLLGDVMIILTAIGAWAAQSFSVDFCEKYQLSFKAMNEVRKLINQLEREVKALCPTITLCDHSQLSPPSDQQSKCLRQIILSGFLDKVARKLNDQESSKDGKRKARAAYQSIELETPVYIPRNSCLYSIQPEWIVYQEIYETSKPFMRNVVAIEPDWLPTYAKPLCRFSKPLSEPEPVYDPHDDCIKCYVTCTFGPYGWTLEKPAKIEYPSDLVVDKYRWFIRHLLEGNIIQFFKAHRDKLLSHPKVIHAPYAKLLPRIDTILNTVLSSKICTRSQLFDKWREDKNYLLKEYLQWIREADHFSIESSWPPKK